MVQLPSFHTVHGCEGCQQNVRHVNPSHVGRGSNSSGMGSREVNTQVCSDIALHKVMEHACLANSYFIRGEIPSSRTTVVLNDDRLKTGREQEQRLFSERQSFVPAQRQRRTARRHHRTKAFSTAFSTLNQFAPTTHHLNVQRHKPGYCS